MPDHTVFARTIDSLWLQLSQATRNERQLAVSAIESFVEESREAINNQAFTRAVDDWLASCKLLISDGRDANQSDVTLFYSARAGVSRVKLLLGNLS